MWLTVIPTVLLVKLLPCEMQDWCKSRFSAPSIEGHLHLHIDCEDGAATIPFPIMSTTGMERLLEILDTVDIGWYLSMLPVLLHAPEAQNIPKALSSLEQRILHDPDLTKIACTFGYISGR